MDREQLKDAFVNAADARKTEIGLLWSRSLYFWGFLAVALTSYSAAFNASYFSFAVLAGSAGWITSLCWSLANRSSKFWQETWEQKADSYAYEFLGERLFTDNSRGPVETRGWLSAKRFSVSKLAMAVSDMFSTIWVILILVAFGMDVKCGGSFLVDILAMFVTGIYTGYIFNACRTERLS